MWFKVFGHMNFYLSFDIESNKLLFTQFSFTFFFAARAAVRVASVAIEIQPRCAHSLTSHSDTLFISN